MLAAASLSQVLGADAAAHRGPVASGQMQPVFDKTGWEMFTQAGSTMDMALNQTRENTSNFSYFSIIIIYDNLTF